MQSFFFLFEHKQQKFFLTHDQQKNVCLFVAVPTVHLLIMFMYVLYFHGIEKLLWKQYQFQYFHCDSYNGHNFKIANSSYFFFVIKLSEL